MVARLFRLPKPRHVSVEFSDVMSVEEVVEEIGRLEHPQIVVWYIGAYGLRKAGVDFYREKLIRPVLEKKADATFWLVDLTAWGAFRDRHCSVYKESCCCVVIDRFSDPRVRCIRSAKLFKKMQKMEDVEYFKKVLGRDFIHKPSRGFPKRGFCVREIFKDDCPVMEDWYDQDTGAAYSVFQYLEGCLMVDEILEQTKRDAQIVFVLPNDELKYYRDELGSFQKDVEFLCGNVRIKFLAFKYGTEKKQRPYNAPGKVLKRGNLTYEHVVGGRIHRRPKIAFEKKKGAIQVEIETERLRMHSYRDEDFEHCVALYGNKEITKYFDHGQPRSRKEVEDLVKEKGNRYFVKGEPFGLFSIFHKKDGSFIGQVDLVPMEEKGVAEIGCILDGHYHKQGFCGEALRALMFDYVHELNSRSFKCYGIPVRKVIATTHPENYPSKKVIEKLGMSCNGMRERFGTSRLWYSYIPESALFLRIK